MHFRGGLVPVITKAILIIPETNLIAITYLDFPKIVFIDGEWIGEVLTPTDGMLTVYITSDSILLNGEGI